jgi:hypothetical protein
MFAATNEHRRPIKKTKIVIYSGSITPVEQLELEKTGADYTLIKASNCSLLKSSIGEMANCVDHNFRILPLPRCPASGF